MKLGIIGATGAVGKVFLNLLPSSNLNITDLRLSASSRSIGKKINYQNQDYTIQENSDDFYSGLDFVFSSALMTAISLSGRQMDNFIFEGFFPRKSKDQLILTSMLRYRMKDTFIFESPKRIQSTLNFLKNKLLKRDVIVFHELTKLNEKVNEFNLSDLHLYDFKSLGEYIILVSGISIKYSKIDKEFLIYIKDEIKYLVDNGLSLKNAAKIIADIFDLPRKDIYNIWIDKN